MTRVLSALVLLPVVLGVIWFLPPVATLVLALAAAVLAALEYTHLARALGAEVPRAITVTAVVAAVASIGMAITPLEIVLMSASIVVGLLAVGSGAPGPGALRDTAASLFPILYIGLPLGAIVAVRVLAGREAVLLLLTTIVVSDSAQYYTGRAFGRTKLAPAISPKKTREGAIGGVVFGTLAMTIGALFVFPSAQPVLVALAAGAVVGLGMAGDLFESLLKRSAGVKDSGALIPGHGGVLDRIDSWLFAAPVYYVFVRYMLA
jgi:phosphatidate cytidylyltransferase